MRAWAVAVTTTVTVHEPLAGTVRFDRVSAVWPATKTLPAAPTQVPPAAPAAETAMFVSASVKPAAVSAVPLVLASVKVIVDVPSALIVAGAKALAIVGTAAFTVRVAMFGRRARHRLGRRLRRPGRCARPERRS